MVIAGNTTMCYLLLGLRCCSLGLAPFVPEFRIEGSYPYEEIFGADSLSCPCMIYPFLSAFVGGDIAAGLVNIEQHGRKDSPYMLVDLGTNGEIVYKNGTRLLVTSTAAGPALEGGNISCGMGAVAGAIYEVNFGKDANQIQTISDAPPIGICGSGVISICAQMLQNGLIEESGRFADWPVSEIEIAPARGDLPAVVFAQQDVRELQLAKGAIRAGIDILIEEMGAPPDVLYLAGGFGQHIDLESAFAIGLLPASVRGRTEIAGNTSLGGAIDVCLSGEFPETVGQICAAAEEINLASHKRFEEVFLQRMGF
jgi:uncharacterized 2Fe-2S/4Fe-4S cluster protein (DUF4445 family)